MAILGDRVAPARHRRERRKSKALRKRVLTVGAATMAAALITGAGWVASLQGRTYDVVAVLGQSNAVGSGVGWEPLGADLPDVRVQQLADSGPFDGLVLPAIDPLWHEDAAFAKTGFATTFADRYAEETGHEVLVVPTAVGWTGFTSDGKYSWDPADTSAEKNLFTLATQQIDAALAKNKNSRLVGVLWHQGEYDVTRLSPEQYSAKLGSVIDELRERYGDVPFLAGQMNPDWVGSDPARLGIDAAHKAVTSHRPETAFVPGPTGLSNPGDIVHYNAAGQRSLGENYWAVFKERFLP